MKKLFSLAFLIYGVSVSASELSEGAKLRKDLQSINQALKLAEAKNLPKTHPELQALIKKSFPLLNKSATYLLKNDDDLLFPTFLSVAIYAEDVEPSSLSAEIVLPLYLQKKAKVLEHLARFDRLRSARLRANIKAKALELKEGNG